MRRHAVQKTQKKIAYLARAIKLGEKDVLEGLQEIYRLWPKSGFPFNALYQSIGAINADVIAMERSAGGQLSEAFLTWKVKYCASQEKMIHDVLEDLSRMGKYPSTLKHGSS